MFREGCVSFCLGTLFLCLFLMTLFHMNDMNDVAICFSFIHFIYIKLFSFSKASFTA